MGQLGYELGDDFGAVDLCAARVKWDGLGHLGHELYK